MPLSTAAVFFSHELAHALDDQHHGLDTLMEKTKDDDDRSLAISAVAEGSATVIMSLFIVQEMRAGRLTPEAFGELQRSEAGHAERLTAAPPILQRSLIGPYVLGQAFLLHGDPEQLSSFDGADIERAFRDPPKSSEQIIHSEKYWQAERRDEPRPVRLPDLSLALGPGWKRAASGTMGELTLAVLAGLGGIDVRTMDSARPERWTNAAATGWGGDVFQHYVSGARSLTIVATLWDTPADAAEFEKAVVPSAGRLISRRWDTVLVIGGDAGSHPEALVDAVFLALATGKVPSGTAVR
jgi:hypothetical protein